MTELTVFQYPGEMVSCRCEEIAEKVMAIEDMRVRFSVQCRIEIGALLNQARDLLGYGKYGEWLAWRLPEWSEDATRRWRVLADRVSKNPKISEILGQFQSTAAAEEYVCLPESVQAQVVEKKAYTWSEFKAVRWDAAMRERLADNGLDYNQRHGDVLHAIEDAKDDPALKEVAATLYQENRETFARLADRKPEEVDVEVGVRPTPPPANKPNAQLVEGDEGYWLCRWDGKEMQPIAQVSKHLLMWPGPTILAAFPETNDGPASKSWQGAVIESAVRRVNASTMQSTYGEVL